MNPHRIAIALLATASLGIGACGSGNDNTDQLQQRAKEVRKEGVAIQEQGAQISKDAKAGKDTTKAQQDLENRANAAAGKTKAIADDAINDVKNKTSDAATKKAIEQVQSQITEVPLPTP